LARVADESMDPPVNWPEVFDKCPVPIPRVDRYDVELPEFAEGPLFRALVLAEQIGYGDTWPRFVAVSPSSSVLRAMGTPEQIAYWTAPERQRTGRWGFGLSEPEFGSDTSMVATTAVRDGHEWVLNGTKSFAGADSSMMAVFATIDKAAGSAGIRSFMVPMDSPGVQVVRRNDPKLGVRCDTTSQIAFDDVRIPVDYMIGWTEEHGEDVNRGRNGAMKALNTNRPTITMRAVGNAQAAIDVTREELQSRRDGFTPRRWAKLEDELAVMDATLDRARHACYYAQALGERGIVNKAEVSVAKVYGPETMERVIKRCMEFLGPDGSSYDFLLEKWYRDVKTYDIVEGTGQIQRLVLARTMLGRLAG
jgi:acyl-CoA dehydrogenase